jgi:hypothetical protein
MSIDLTAAVEAAAVVEIGLSFKGDEFARIPVGTAAAEKILTAAAPLIEAAVRERIAADIEAAVDRAREVRQSTYGLWPGMEFAARIARGEVKP